jgi:2-C-methyl-D-erythritol 4-phosphate cytidylyltransferase
MNIAVLLAAGSGTRLNSNKAKQFLEINGKELYTYALDVFNMNKNIDKILVITRGEDIAHIKETTENYSKVLDVIAGGKTRELSVKAAIEYLNNFVKEEDVILIHDAARPLINDRIINENVKAVNKYEAAVTAIKATDSILVGNENVKTELNRNEIWHAQTPQSFKFKLLKNAFNKFDETLTDDVAVALNIGFNPLIVWGEKSNIKITTSEDIDLSKIYLKN